MTKYIAYTPTHIILKGENWSLLYLDFNQHLNTSLPFEVFDKREDAVQAMLRHDPDFEDDWEGTGVPESVSSGKFWVALYDADKSLCEQAQMLVDKNPRMRLAAQHEGVINRNSTYVRQVQEALGVSNAYMDALFIKASQTTL